MGKLFYLNEIIKFAVQKEIESYELYKNIALQVQDNKTKKIFQNLMQAELNHRSYYEKMLGKTKKEQTPQVKENKEYKAYMQELITSSRETKPLTTKQIANIDKALNFAMDREKDSILFYVGLKNFVSKSVVSKIDEIISEESKHLVAVASLKKSLL